MTWNYKFGEQTYKVTDRWSLASPVDVKNIQAEIRQLNGRHPKDVFGEDVALGDIHFTEWQPDTCACLHLELVNYPARAAAHALFVASGGSLDKMTPDQRAQWESMSAKGQEVPHKIIVACDVHARHGNDPASHHAAIQRENKHKNSVVGAHAREHAIAPHEIAFQLDQQRRLVISHPAFGKKVIPLPSVN